MESIRVAVCIRDDAFAVALARGLARESRNMQIRVGETRGSQLILYDTASVPDPIPEHGVILSKDQGSCDYSKRTLFLYEDSRVLVNQLIYIYFDLTGRMAEYRHQLQSKVIAFASLSGGAGVTSLAVAAGRMFDLIYGSRCLYLNLKPFDDSCRYLERNDDGSLMKLLFHLERSDEVPLKAFIREGEGVDLLMTNAWNQHVQDLTEERMERLLSQIDDLGCYRYVLLDIGNHLSRQNMERIRTCDCLVLVTPYSEGQKQVVVQQAEDVLRNLADCSITVVNRGQGYADQEDAPFYIAEEENAFVRMNGFIRHDLRGEYGLDCARLVKELEEQCNGKDQ